MKIVCSCHCQKCGVEISGTRGLCDGCSANVLRAENAKLKETLRATIETAQQGEAIRRAEIEKLKADLEAQLAEVAEGDDSPVPDLGTITFPYGCAREDCGHPAEAHASCGRCQADDCECDNGFLVRDEPDEPEGFQCGTFAEPTPAKPDDNGLLATVWTALAELRSLCDLRHASLEGKGAALAAKVEELEKATEAWAARLQATELFAGKTEARTSVLWSERKAAPPAAGSTQLKLGDSHRFVPFVMNPDVCVGMIGCTERREHQVHMDLAAKVAALDKVAEDLRMARILDAKDAADNAVLFSGQITELAEKVTALETWAMTVWFASRHIPALREPEFPGAPGAEPVFEHRSGCRWIHIDGPCEPEAAEAGHVFRPQVMSPRYCGLISSDQIYCGKLVEHPIHDAVKKPCTRCNNNGGNGVPCAGCGRTG